MNLDPLPSPDGAPFTCGALFHPYTGDEDKCPKVATGLLTRDDLNMVRAARSELMVLQPKSIWPMYLYRAVCDSHLKVANEIVALRYPLNPST